MNRRTTINSATKIAATTLLAFTLLVTTFGLATPASAGGKKNTKPDAAVSLGDSFISGEGGRWNGNSNDGYDPDRDGTDRAYRSTWYGGWWYDYDAVYPGSYDNGCHRSDVSEIKSSGIPMNLINLACSGAETEHIFRASNGGQNFKGEIPQADQLAALAATYDIELVVLSIGGNDLGFSDVLTDCITAFSTGAAPCAPTAQITVDNAIPTVMADVTKAINEIKTALADAGDTDYRFVLQSYPSPVPRSSEADYSENTWDRLHTGGCPFWDTDLDFARDYVVPTIDANLSAVAAAAGVEFLSLAQAFDGKEVCGDDSRLVNGDSDTPNGATHEWMRFLTSGAVQGNLAESMHPNAFGQKALGTCLGQLWNAGSGSYTCTNQGAGETAMTLTAN